MADYRQIIPFILRHEGGVSRDVRDSASARVAPGTNGAHTNKGVTWATFKALAARLGYTPTAALFLEMPIAVWGVIFKKGYWDPLKLDHIKHQGVADVLVDFAWGAGPVPAAKGLQRALGVLGRAVPVDGKVGRQTLAAANAAGGPALLVAVNAEKRRYYFSQEQNAWAFAGWKRRFNELEELAKKQ